ncbi:MAG: FHA domain-containing protein [Myxococcales bacterium]|nr:MAG: FHA domain-containing protein [Myxococcales bacterium]
MRSPRTGLHHSPRRSSNREFQLTGAATFPNGFQITALGSVCVGAYPPRRRIVTTETTLMDGETSEQESGFHLLVMTPDAFATYPLLPGCCFTFGRASSSSVRLDDPKVSRNHASVYLTDQISIEDSGSRNGTRVQGLSIPPGKRVPVMPGQAIEIGSAVLVVLRQSTDCGPRRLWSHQYFLTRLHAECLAASGAAVGPAVIRVRLEDPGIWNDVLPILVTSFPPPHLLAAYGPGEYEVLVAGKTVGGAEAMSLALSSRFEAADLPVRVAIATFPRDGSTVEALVGEAGARLRSTRDSEEPKAHPASSMSPVKELARKGAQSSINILLLGETGVGKEVMTKFIHGNSPRAARPLFCLNCASIQESLLESELFGHERGAFTGAIQAKIGIFEAADGGTVFLDEIGEMPLPLQAKLLRVLEAKQVTRVGALKPKNIDVRFIAATNRDLEKEVAEGRFRQDLFFRLNGLCVKIPPLRERRAEIATLAREFLASAARDLGHQRLTFAEEVLQALEGYDFPGNIRELKNIVERAAVLCGGDRIELSHLPPEKFDRAAAADRETPPFTLPSAAARLPGPATIVESEDAELDPAQRAERARIVEALSRCAGNQTRVAELLGMPRRTLVFKLKAYRIPRPRRRPAPSLASTDTPE